MSDEESATPPASAPTDEAPRVRRISNPRPKKKSARNAKTTAERSESAEPAVPPSDAPQESKFPEFPEPAAATPEPAEESAEESLPPADWPEPEAPSAGDTAQPGAAKRKRRRKKGKGGQNAATVTGDTPEPQPAAAASEAPAPQATRQPHQPQSRPKLDAEQLAKCAWKIFLAEVSEEGIALIGDNDARELSRRCFRLAEIFLEEQARRR